MNRRWSVGDFYRVLQWGSGRVTERSESPPARAGSGTSEVGSSKKRPGRLRVPYSITRRREDVSPGRKRMGGGTACGEPGEKGPGEGPGKKGRAGHVTPDCRTPN